MKIHYWLKTGIIDLIKYCKEAYITDIEPMDVILSKKINDKLDYDNDEFNEILKNRDDCEEIKNEYNRILGI